MQPNGQSTGWERQTIRQPRRVSEYKTAYKPCNPEKLAEDLRAALGDADKDPDGKFGALNTGSDITVVLYNATDADKALAEKIVDEHGPGGESQEQATRREAREALERLKALDPAGLGQAETLETVRDMLRVVVQLATEGVIRRD